MSYTRVGLIHNNQARGGNPRVSMQRLLYGMKPIVWDFEANSLEEMRRVVEMMINDEVNLIVVSGGDGTFFHVFNYYVHNVGIGEAKKIYWAFIPNGTTNFIGRTFGVPRSPRRAFRVLMRKAKNGIGAMSFRGVRMLKISWGDKVCYCFATGIGAAANFLQYYYSGGHGSWHVIKALTSGIGAYALHMAGLENGIAQGFLDFPKFEIRVDGKDLSDSPFKVGFFTSIDMRLVVFRPVHFLLDNPGGNVFTMLGDPTAWDIARAIFATPFGGRVSGRKLITQRAKEVSFCIPQTGKTAPFYADGEVGGKDLTLGKGETLTISEGPSIMMPVY